MMHYARLTKHIICNIVFSVLTNKGGTVNFRDMLTRIGFYIVGQKILLMPTVDLPRVTKGWSFSTNATGPGNWDARTLVASFSKRLR